MGFCVYILYSRFYKRTYTGQTNNLNARLKLHNLGKVRSTRPFIPWEIVYYEEFGIRSEAMKREKWFKSRMGRKKITEILENLLLK